MRVIEQQMIDAITLCKNWRGANTSVTYNAAENRSDVRLHGHLIASYWHYTGRNDTPSGLVVDVLTLQQWPTRTTMSRLRALGANVYQKRGDVYLNDQRVN